MMRLKKIHILIIIILVSVYRNKQSSSQNFLVTETKIY